MAVWWRVDDGACANNRGSARSELTPHLAGEADTAISGLAEPRQHSKQMRQFRIWQHCQASRLIGRLAAIP